MTKFCRRRPGKDMDFGELGRKIGPARLLGDGLKFCNDPDDDLKAFFVF